MSLSKQNRRWFLGLTLTLVGILLPATPPYLLCIRLIVGSITCDARFSQK
jgi:hypothetical protein